MCNKIQGITTMSIKKNDSRLLKKTFVKNIIKN